MPPSSVFDLIMFVDAVVDDMNETAIAALLEVAAALRGHPLAGLDVVVWLAFLFHALASCKFGRIRPALGW
jgi:hypothetical protein